MKETYKIAVAGTGYVGLSNAVLLSQHNKVTAVDIIPEKVEMINQRRSPIVDKELEEYLAKPELNLTATTTILQRTGRRILSLSPRRRIMTWSEIILTPHPSRQSFSL